MSNTVLLITRQATKLVIRKTASTVFDSWYQHIMIIVEYPETISPLWPIPLTISSIDTDIDWIIITLIFSHLT